MTLTSSQRERTACVIPEGRRAAPVAQAVLYLLLKAIKGNAHGSHAVCTGPVET